MFKIFNDVAIDTKKISALYTSDDRVVVQMDNGCSHKLASFWNKEHDERKAHDAAKNYFAQLVDQLNADT